MTMRAKEWIIFFLVAITGAWFIQGSSWNQNARFDLTRAIVEKQSLDCSDYADNSGDILHVNGRVVPYKAPGISLLCVPFWAVFYWGGCGHIAASPFALNFGLYLLTIITGILPLAWAAIWFFRFCLALCPGKIQIALWTTLTAFFGTLIFPVGTMMLGHATVAALCWVAFVRALCVVRNTENNGFMIGLLLGIAVAVDYFALPVALVIFVLALIQGAGGSWRAIVLGALPSVLVLCAYHWVIMGAPWRIPYSTPPEDFATDGAVGGLFLWPSLHVIWNTTFGSYRGLFFSSPVLLAGFWGLAVAWRLGSIWKKAVLTSLFIIAAHFAFVWSFNGWHGGWSFGIRYFLPAIPFLAWPLCLIIDRARGVVRCLAIISIAMMLAATSVNPLPPPGNPDKAIPSPWFDYYFPAFASGHVADHVQSVVEKYPRYETWPHGRALWVKALESFDRRNAPPGESAQFEKWRREQLAHWWRVSLLYPAGIYNPRHPEVAGATNWGLLMGLPGLLSLLPLAIIWAILGVLFFRKTDTS